MSDDLFTRHKRELNNLKIYSLPSVIEGYAKWESSSPAEEAAIKFAICDQDHVLDIGCGSGRLARLLENGDIKYHGIDLSEGMLQVARNRFPNLSFSLFDAFDLNPKKDKYNCVLFMHNGIDLLYPYNRRLELFNIMKSILHPNGKLIFSSHVPDWDGRDSKVIKGFLPKIYRLIKRITNSKCGFVPEDYRGKLLWIYRASINAIENDLNKLDLQLEAVFPDGSRTPPDWNYYVAKIKN